MYNSELKTEYIESLPISKRRNVIDTFKATEVYEDFFEKDLNLFMPEEIEAVLGGIKVFSFQNFKTIANAIKSYEKYCIENKYLDENIISKKKEYKISYAGIPCGANIGISGIKNPEHLLEILNSVYPISEGRPIYSVSMLLYNGVPMTDVYDLMENDVDIENRIINVKGKEYKIYDEFVEPLSVIKGLKTVVRYEPVNDNTAVYKSDSPFFIKKFSKNKTDPIPYSSNNIAGAYITFIDKYNKKNKSIREFTPKIVSYNSILYNMYLYYYTYYIT